MEDGKAEFENFASRAFFAQLHGITMAGFFSDPIYGGNRDKVGWKLLGFPGLPATYADKIDAYRDKRYVADPQSIADFSLKEAAMATRLKETDAVVIGMGFSGAILSRELTKAGLNVVGLRARRRPQSGRRVHADAAARRAALCGAAGIDAGQFDRHHHLPQRARRARACRSAASAPSCPAKASAAPAFTGARCTGASCRPTSASRAC